MRILVSNFTIKYNSKAAYIGLVKTAAASAYGTRMQTNKFVRIGLTYSDSDLCSNSQSHSGLVLSQLTLLTEPGHCSLRMLLKLLLLLWVWGSARQDGPRPTNTSPAPAPGPPPAALATPAELATARARYDARKNIKDAIKIIL